MADPRLRLHAASSRRASQIGRYLINQDSHPNLADLMVDYIEGRFGNADTEADHEQPRCLLGCGSFKDITQHFKNCHKDLFNRPFYCPECRKLGKDHGQIQAGLQSWSSHVEQYHGRVHRPLFTERSSYCHLCEQSFTAGGIASHITGKHTKKGQFQRPFPCPACQRQGDNETYIDGLDAWLLHVASAHGDKQTMHRVTTNTKGEECERKAAVAGKKRTRQHQGGLSGRTRRKLTSTGTFTAPSNTRESVSHNVMSADTAEWIPGDSPDPHAEEEFWVTGRD